MMNQEDLFKKIGLILNDLNDQYQFLASNPQELNELELELFHANANFLADHIQVIKKIETKQQVAIEAPKPVVETTEDIVVQLNPDQQSNVTLFNDAQEEQQVEAVTFAHEVEPEPEELYVPEPDAPIAEIEKEIFKIDNEPSTFEFILNDHAEHEKFEFEEKSVDEIFNRALSNDEERIIAEKQKLSAEPVSEILDKEEDEIGPEPFLVYKKEAEPFVIATTDLNLEEAPVEQPIIKSNEPVEDPGFKPTLNDLLANKSSVNTTHINKSTLTDLRQAISLNDKLLYIKDLFNGYNLSYAEAIDVANKLPNLAAADNFFQHNYAVKNNWATKQATVDKFYELLSRRFGE